MSPVRQPGPTIGDRRPAGPSCPLRRRASRRPVQTGGADEGLATVVVVGGLAALLVVVTVATWFTAAVIARHRAAGAADLAALAGGAVVVRGADAACAEAVRIAVANGASVQDCRVTGADVRIVAAVELHIGPIAGTATARARAGPVAADPTASAGPDGAGDP